MQPGITCGSDHSGNEVRLWLFSFVTTDESSAVSTSRSCANTKTNSETRVQRWPLLVWETQITPGSFVKRPESTFRCSLTRNAWPTKQSVSNPPISSIFSGGIISRHDHELAPPVINNMNQAGTPFNSAAASCLRLETATSMPTRVKPSVIMHPPRPF